MREATGRFQGPPANGAPRRMLTHRFAVLGVTVAALTILGPFGTFQDMALPARLAYWGGLIAVGALLFDLVMLVAQRVLTDHARTWPLMLGAAVLTVSLVQTLLVATLEHELRRSSVAASLGLVELYGYVLVVTLLVSAVPIRLELHARGLLGHPPQAEDPVEAAPVAAPAPVSPAPVTAPFLDRIPDRLGRELLALEMEDHYVRVHTTAGSDLVLMRLRDAIATLNGIDGLQVHRSHWVAASAVTGVERRPDGKLVLRLSNGLRVPVSRSHAAAVRAAGWAEHRAP
ncbi:LytTR family DNA-binding domain-containing protein [Azospirillum doebereinerae]|uniref:LytTR family DNA-binding domain-containing protein n=1 Tax=Azospirillum doebereinerae TaxID=92933 RepID=UPI001EE54142|nr:LytTR family DNA-binding domain-containing protein [Azospirillum doebereinerae]MCG5242073.1 LytTR family transcriptional regulator [Azospirillum doebereinerae]